MPFGLCPLSTWRQRQRQSAQKTQHPYGIFLKSRLFKDIKYDNMSANQTRPVYPALTRRRVARMPPRRKLTVTAPAPLCLAWQARSSSALSFAANTQLSPSSLLKTVVHVGMVLARQARIFSSSFLVSYQHFCAFPAPNTNVFAAKPDTLSTLSKYSRPALTAQFCKVFCDKYLL